MAKSTTNLLTIQSLALATHIGWTAQERSKRQIILVDITIAFAKTPKACLSDQLDETYCYDTLVNQLHQHIRSTSYRLIEHMAYDIHAVMKTLLPKKTRISIVVTKHPRVKGLRGGVRFEYGDC